MINILGFTGFPNFFLESPRGTGYRVPVPDTKHLEKHLPNESKPIGNLMNTLDIKVSEGSVNVVLLVI
jgi:hypothetical protein